MNLAGTTLVIRGEVECSSDLTIEGTIEGPVWSDGKCVTVGPKATIKGDIIAGTILVQGSVTGDLMATTTVHIAATARVAGRVLSPKLALAEGASFNGSVEPQKADSAMSVARHKQQKT